MLLYPISAVKTRYEVMLDPWLYADSRADCRMHRQVEALSPMLG